MSEFKKQFDAALGKAATIIGEQTGKVAEFFADTKEKATEYLDTKKEIYETKTALDAAKAKVESLFNEIGRISFYGKAVTPERKRPLVKAELIAALDEVENLQEKYDALYADKEVSDDEI